MAINVCGLYFIGAKWHYLPLVDIHAHATLLSTTSRTTLTQTYLNPAQNGHVQELRYSFPLFDGVSVVAFTCRIGDRTIVGQVKERERAKKVFADAVARGENAALLEQLPQASDVFTTTVGNVPAGAKVIIEITYLGELKHDAEVDGVRFTIPTAVMPRYGDYPVDLAVGATECVAAGRAQITVDIVQDETSFIQQIKSPSHLLAVSLGTTSLAPNADPVMSKASATLSLESAALDKDFVVQVVAKNSGLPTAMLETHPTIPNQQAMMVTLVPRFSLPPERPELVFVVDRSGSMQGTRISLVKSAMKVFLKSIPVGVKFNICSFGSRYSFLWKDSQAYTQSTLEEAIQHVDSIEANFGGTEMYQPIEATLKQRFKDLPLEVMLLTDGEIWDQETLFEFLNKNVSNSKTPIRVFTLGIGNGVSHSLIEGVAKAGNGFSQSVGEGEKMDSKVVRMLKGALSPHITDYTLEVKYADEDAMTDVGDDDFELVEKVADSLNVKLGFAELEPPQAQEKKSISLFDTSVDLDKEAPSPADDDSGAARYAHLPPLAAPKLLQAPSVIPQLYAFNRTTVYLLLDPKCSLLRPKAVVLRGTSTHGPLELEIPVQILDAPGETIHQLAAKKAISELEQGRGWMAQAKDETGELISSKHPGRFSEMVEREAVRLGVLFQVGGKWCSFVAVENEEHGDKAIEIELLSVPSAPVPTRTITTSNVAQVFAMSRSAPRSLCEMTSRSFSAPQKGRGARSGSKSKSGYVYASPPNRASPPGFCSRSLAVGASPVAFGSTSPSFGSPASAFGSASPSFGSSTSTFGSAGSGFGSAPTPASAGGQVFGGFGSAAGGSAPPPPPPPPPPAPMGAAPPGAAMFALPSAVPYASFSSVSSVSSAHEPLQQQQQQQHQQQQRLAASESKLETLVDLQTFEGYWECNPRLFSCVEVSVDQAERVAKEGGWNSTVVATALVIAYFEKKLAKEKDTWELLIQKARNWLEEQVGQDVVSEVLEKATALIV